LYVVNITEHHASIQKLKFLNRIKLSLHTNGRLWSAAEFGQIWCGEPRNFANWPAKFGKIYRGKLWALLINT